MNVRTLYNQIKTLARESKVISNTWFEDHVDNVLKELTEAKCVEVLVQFQLPHMMSVMTMKLEDSGKYFSPRTNKELVRFLLEIRYDEDIDHGEFLGGDDVLL